MCVWWGLGYINIVEAHISLMDETAKKETKYFMKAHTADMCSTMKSDRSYCITSFQIKMDFIFILAKSMFSLFL